MCGCLTNYFDKWKIQFQEGKSTVIPLLVFGVASPIIGALVAKGVEYLINKAKERKK